MPFQIIRNDITKVKADAIVNTANPKPRFGPGTNSAVYAAAGEEQLLAARREIGEIAPGQSAATPAFNLHAKHIIHTAGPVWEDGEHGEREILSSCYRNSLALAKELKCRSVAFPLMASGSNGFPKGEALDIALSEIGTFLLTNEMKVLLVVFDRASLNLSEELVGEIESYIDDNAVNDLGRIEYEGRERRRRESRSRRESSDFMALESLALEEEPEPDGIAADEHEAIQSTLPDVSGKSLDDVMSETGETFQQRLFKLIDERKLDDVTVYKKANIDRKVFSRIRCKKDYQPKKKTAVALAIALELDLPTASDLLARAGMAFSPSSKYDLIIMYFISRKKYNIYEIDAALFRYGQETFNPYE